MSPVLASFLAVLLVSMISLVGLATLGMGVARLKKLLLVLVSLSVGTLFGSAFFHLLPEAFASQGYGPEVPLWVLTGLLTFFVLEKFIHWRHCHVPPSSDHPHPVVFMNFVGDGLHNLIDGILIGAAFMVSIPIGITTTVAVAAHEIPQEIGDFGTLVWGGLSVKKALLFNFVSGLSALLGVSIVWLIGPHVAQIEQQILPLTAGGFIYIAGSDLIPELRKDVRIRHSLSQLLAILAGLALMYFISSQMPHTHIQDSHEGHDHGNLPQTTEQFTVC